MKKTKQCGICLMQKVIWKARTRDSPQMCQHCYMNQPKPSILSPVVSLIQDMQLAAFKQSKQKPIPNVSSKQLERLKAYKKVRDEYMKSHLICEAQLIDKGCTMKATDFHHSAGKTGNLLTNPKYFKALCRTCHEYIERSPSFAKENGFSVDRLDK